MTKTDKSDLEELKEWVITRRRRHRDNIKIYSNNKYTPLYVVHIIKARHNELIKFLKQIDKKLQKSNQNAQNN